MTFRIALHIERPLAPLHVLEQPPVESDPPYDPILDIIAQCKALARTKSLRFHVGGFGQDSWPVDVETDLSVAIEQLPRALRAIARRSAFKLDFYEQGTERYLACTVNGDVVEIECRSMNTWSPNPATEIEPVAFVQKMLGELRSSYLLAVDAVCPWLAPEPFRKWMNG